MVRHHIQQHIHVRVSREVFAKLHEWMDTFQMNPKAIFASMAFHHPDDMQAFYRMHNVKRSLRQDRTHLGQIELKSVSD